MAWVGFEDQQISYSEGGDDVTIEFNKIYFYGDEEFGAIVAGVAEEDDCTAGGDGIE